MTKIYQKRFKNSCPIDHSTTHYTTQLEIQIETCRSILLLTTLLIERYCKRFSPLDVYFFSKTRQQRQNHKEETRHQNSMTTTCGLGGRVNFLRLVWSTGKSYPPHPAKTGTRVG